VYGRSLPAFSLVLWPRAPHGARDLGALDASRAFFGPAFATRPDEAIAETALGPITAGVYLRYLAAELGPRHLEDLAFDWLLERECQAQKLARTAPVLARSLAVRRLFDSGRTTAQDPDGSLQRKFANEALRQLRVDALVRAERARDVAAQRVLFDHRFGKGGERVHVREILVSFAATERRLAAATGQPPEQAAVVAAARERAAALKARLRAGESFAVLLAESDDRATRALLRDPERAAQAGRLAGYNYDRYGSAYADAVRKLAKDEVSPPIETAQGVHLVQLLDRVLTRFEDVANQIADELCRRPVSAGEAQALRRALLAKHRVRLGG
jgi:hypothetical protein